MCAGEKARKRGIHPGFEPLGRRHQKSKTGVSVAPQKRLMSSNLKTNVCFLSQSLISAVANCSLLAVEQ